MVIGAHGLTGPLVPPTVEMRVERRAAVVCVTRRKREVQPFVQMKEMPQRIRMDVKRIFVHRVKQIMHKWNICLSNNSCILSLSNRVHTLVSEGGTVLGVC